jgi:hypothetical protein
MKSEKLICKWGRRVRFDFKVFEMRVRIEPLAEMATNPCNVRFGSVATDAFSAGAD